MKKVGILLLIVIVALKATIFDDIKEQFTKTEKTIEKPFLAVDKKYEELRDSIRYIATGLNNLIATIKEDVSKTTRLIDDDLIKIVKNFPEITTRAFELPINEIKRSIDRAKENYASSTKKIQNNDFTALPEFVTNSQVLISAMLEGSVALIDATFDKIPWDKPIGTVAQVAAHLSEVLYKITIYLGTLTDKVIGELLDQRAAIAPSMVVFDQIESILSQINRFSVDLARLAHDPVEPSHAIAKRGAS